MEPSMPASLFVAIVGALIAIIASIITATSRWGYNSDKRALNERLTNVEAAAAARIATVEKVAADRAAKSEGEVLELRRENNTMRDRLHADELATMEQRGELALVKQKHDEHATDITEIKKQMVTRDLFEAHTRSTNTMLETILKAVTGSGRYSAVRPPSPPYRGGETSEPPPRPTR